MRDIWLISDLHFGHRNIIKFLKTGKADPIRPHPLNNSPFRDIQEHDEYLIDAINSVVKPQSGAHVWHCGDFGDLKVRPRLNGVWNNILGNHDDDVGTMVNGFTEHYEENGIQKFRRHKIFDKVRAQRLFDVGGVRFMVTHMPIVFDPYSKYTVNVHGHWHEKKVMKGSQEDSKYMSVCVEQLPFYKPIHIEDVAKEVKKRNSMMGL